MSIRITIAGTVFETDSVDEAIEIHRALSHETTVAPTANGHPATAQVPIMPSPAAPAPAIVSGERSERRFTRAAIESFIAGLNVNGTNIVATLAANPDGQTTDELAQAVHLPAGALPPVIRHVRTAADRAGLDPDRVLRRLQISEEGRPKSRYRIAQEVIEVIEKA